MQEFDNKVAVITGGASGIGFAIAKKCLQERMHVVLADVEEAALQGAAELLGDSSKSVLPVLTDVGVRNDVENLAKKTVDEFGAVHLLVNNAGVGAGAGPCETTYDDWEWVVNVNLWSVVYGIKSFLPILESQEGQCHIVNTSSSAGLVYGAGPAPYSVTKHGVVALSECLYFSNKAAGSNVGVSVLCPGYTATNILDSARNRPSHLSNQTEINMTPERAAFVEEFARRVREGMTPEHVADLVFTGIRSNQLYIVTSREFDDFIVDRANRIVSGTNPPSW